MNLINNIKNILANRTFEDHLQNDFVQHENYLARPKYLANTNANDKVIKQEQNALDIYKKVINLLEITDLKITSQEGKTVSAHDNTLPIQSYLSHGSRVMVQLPPGSDHSLFHYLTTPENTSIEEYKLKEKTVTLLQESPAFNRLAATHDISVIEKDGHLTVKENKGFMIGLKSAVSSMFYSAAKYVPFLGNYINAEEKSITKHWGIDLALNKDTPGIDSDHGHLYIHYEPATHDKPGGILLGIEASSPNSSNHSKFGSSDPYTATHGLLWEDLKKITPSEIIIPSKYNGLTLGIKQEVITSLVQKQIVKSEDTWTDINDDLETVCSDEDDDSWDVFSDSEDDDNFQLSDSDEDEGWEILPDSDTNIIGEFNLIGDYIPVN